MQAKGEMENKIRTIYRKWTKREQQRKARTLQNEENGKKCLTELLGKQRKATIKGETGGGGGAGKGKREGRKWCEKCTEIPRKSK